MYEQIIIGGGAAALMFTAHIKNKRKTLILEHNNRLGAKLLISGGGRCNFTNRNLSCRDYLGECPFLKSIFKRFSNYDVESFFLARGLEISIKGDSQLFCKNSAKELLNILLREIGRAEVKLNHRVLEVKREKNLFRVKTDKNSFLTKRVIIATGGLSFPQIGATDFGFKVANSFDIPTSTPKPALVGLTLQKEQQFFKELSGVSLDVRITVADREIKGSLLFAHRGITGPAVLDTSLFWDRGKINIDFLPNFNLRRVKSSRKSISNTLPLPKRFIKMFLEHLGVKDKTISTLTKEEFERLELLQNYQFAPAGTFGFSKAEVTKGGVDISKIDSNSLMSLDVKNLFFIGEVLDIAGRVGGFNLQFAFSSGATCANWINKSKL
jgi:predicted Rossmann fold flavoprotein